MSFLNFLGSGGFGLISGIFGGIANMFTNRKTNNTNYKIHRENLAFNREEAQKLREFTRDMAVFTNELNRQNYEDYESPEAQVRQFRDAGLNPYLAIQGGSSGVSAASSSGGSAASAPSSPHMLAPQIGDIIAEIGNNIGQLSLMNAQEKKLNAETDDLIDTRELRMEQLRADIISKCISSGKTLAETKEILTLLPLQVQETQQKIGFLEQQAIYQSIQNSIAEQTKDAQIVDAWANVGLKMANIDYTKKNAARVVAETVSIELGNKLKDYSPEQITKILQANVVNALSKANIKGIPANPEFYKEIGKEVFDIFKTKGVQEFGNNANESNYRFGKTQR